jgi:sodium/potassium-transporting ATPase subunit alpha
MASLQEKVVQSGANVEIDGKKAAEETAGMDERMQNAQDRANFATIAATGSAEFTAAARSGKKGAPSADDAKKEFKMTEHTQAGDCTAAGGAKLWATLGLKDFDPKKGLDTAFVTQRREDEGPNSLTPPPRESELIKFLKCLFNFFACLLWGGAALCLVGYILQESQDNLYLCIVLSFVVVCSGCFEYFQNSKASKLMDSFKEMMPKQVTVVRDGAPSVKNAIELVRGDIIKLNAGDCVPADLVILECTQDAQVDNAALTGESEPQGRKNECTDANAYESKNVAFFGTLVPQGQITGVVAFIGDHTAMGRIARLATATDNEQTPINREIEHFVHIVSAVAMVLGITFFCIGAFSIGTDIITNIVFMIGIIVANVPEGLLVTVTVCLTLTANRMHGKNVLVKNLEGVETLGSTSQICSDKTGTLTQNVMTVQYAVFGKKGNGSVVKAPLDDEEHSFFCCKEVDPTGRKDSKQKPIRSAFREYIGNLNKLHGFNALWRCSCLCNDSAWDESRAYEEMMGADGVVVPNKQAPLAFRQEVHESGNLVAWEAKGNATDNGMLKLAQELVTLDDATVNTWMASGSSDISADAHGAELKAIEIYKSNNVQFEKVAFNSKNKFAVTFCENAADGNSPYMFFKGAPERVMARCNKALVGEGEEAVFEFDNEDPSKCSPAAKEAYDLQYKLSSEGYRVIGLAQKKLDTSVFKKAGDTYTVNGKGIDTSNYNFPIGMSEEDAKEAGLGAFNSNDSADPRQMLTFIGLLALIDPHRPEVPAAVENCKTAGIQVTMVTGDHPITAKAIARNVGIIWGQTVDDVNKANEEAGVTEGQPGWQDPRPVFQGGDVDAIVVPGWEIKDDDDDTLWKFRLSHPQKVFARTSPQQKLKIVENCQKLGHIVAVTGDGVNDSPALKKADIGCAMGIMGSEVSKEAADMILLDDNFASIVAGVQEGRLIFDNLKKSIAYTLSSNIPEISPFLIFITVATPLPLTTILILCVDLGTDMVPAISMAYETPESDIMSRNPRNGTIDRLVTKKLVSFAYLQIGVIQACAGFFTWMVVLNDYGYPPHVLPGLGFADNWQKQPLYCRLKGGKFCNDGFPESKRKCVEVGTGKMANQFELRFQDQPQGIGCSNWGDKDQVRFSALGDNCKGPYALWDAGSDGQVLDCQFALQNVVGEGSKTGGGATADFLTRFKAGTIRNYAAGVDDAKQESYWTGGYAQTTAQSYAAAFGAGYTPYYPYKARTSAFYNSNWWMSPVNGKDGYETPGFSKVIVAQYQPPYGRWLNPGKGAAGGASVQAGLYEGRWVKGLAPTKMDNTVVGTGVQPNNVFGVFFGSTRWDRCTGTGANAAACAAKTTKEACVAPCDWVTATALEPDGTETKSQVMAGKQRDAHGKFKDVLVGTTTFAGKASGSYSCTGTGTNVATCAAKTTKEACVAPCVWGPNEATYCTGTGMTHLRTGGGDDLTFGLQNSELKAGDSRIAHMTTTQTISGFKMTDFKYNVAKTDISSDCYARADGTIGGSTRFKVEDTTAAEKKAGGAWYLKKGTASARAGLFRYPFVAKDVTDPANSQMYSNVMSRMMQKEALHFSQGAFWGSIVIVQWADLVICKTRWLSLANQGMSNSAMNFGLFFETMLAAVLAYTPALKVLGTRPIRFVHWFPAMPFSMFIFAYDETRKFLMRTTSEVSIDAKTGRANRAPGWLEYNTYY